MRASAVRMAGLSSVFVFVLSSCIEVTWMEMVPGPMPPDIKTVQILEFKSMITHEGGTSAVVPVADPLYGKIVATTLTERIQQSKASRPFRGRGTSRASWTVAT